MNWIEQHKHELQEIVNAYQIYIDKAKILTDNNIKFRIYTGPNGKQTIAIDTSTIPIVFEPVEAKVMIHAEIKSK